MASVFDLHVHTNQGSPDSALTPDEMVAEAERLGLTGIMVTEHVGWARPEFEQFAKGLDLVLVNTLEMYTPLGHIITLGLDRYVTGYNGDLETVKTLRREVDRVGGVMILAHPFRHLLETRGNYTQNILFERWEEVPSTPEAAATHPIFDLLDEIEVVNGGNLEDENRFAQSVAEVLGFQGTGGSDAHSVNGLGKGVTVFPGDIRNQADLLESLRAGEFFPVEGFHLGNPVDYGSGSGNGLRVLPRRG